MLVSFITRLLGVSTTIAKSIAVILFAMLAGVLAAAFPGVIWMPPVVAGITAIAALIDPNGGK